jgi:hypothetical protein
VTEPPARTEPLEAGIVEFAQHAKSLLGLGARTRAAIEAQGIHVIRGDYYSPVPTIPEIDGSWEARGDGLPFLETQLYDGPGMLEFLEENLAPFADEFHPALHKEEASGGFYWENPQFSHSDAMAYYCMVRHFRPRRIVEVGGGFSTLVAAQALARNGLGELEVVDPFPSPDMQKAMPELRVRTQPAQDVPLSFFESLRARDILFIDSTHTVKAGGECIYLYLKVLPRLAAGVVVQVHDVFLPQMMPASWMKDLGLYWNEQYLLQAYLLDNPRIKVLFGSHYHRLLNRERLEAFMGAKYSFGGGSYWFEMQ